MAERTTPAVTRDPRFFAGRKLVERGLADEAIDVYATLLEETRHQHGDDSIEAAPAYYEYGNSLLRAATKRLPVEGDDDAETPAAAASKEKQRSASATAAESRLQLATDQKPAAVEATPNQAPGEEGNENDESKEEPNEDEDDPKDDLMLALEMMENSFSILEDYSDNSSATAYSEWANEQIPRILMGIGDTLSTLGRHADAADAYSRALELRKNSLQDFANKEGCEHWTIEHLKAHRMVCEGNVLIAEALLSCPPEEDVVTTETQTLIVKAAERVEYVRGYYDQARDALQETVVFMGSLPRAVDLGREKEDVCFLATLVMGVGESLAAIDEDGAKADATEPVTKKSKRE